MWAHGMSWAVASALALGGEGSVGPPAGVCCEWKGPDAAVLCCAGESRAFCRVAANGLRAVRVGGGSAATVCCHGEGCRATQADSPRGVRDARVHARHGVGLAEFELRRIRFSRVAV